MNKGRRRGIYWRNGIAYIRYRNEEGRIVRESTQQSSAAFAEALLAKRKVEVMERRHFPSRQFADVTFAELLQYWWDMHGQDTKGGFEYLIPRIRAAFGKRKAREIRADDIDRFLHKLRNSGLSPSSCNHHRTILNAVFNFALKRKRYDDNPVRAVPQFREPPGRDRLLTRDEFRRLLAVAESRNIELWCFLIVAVTTAARKGEILPRRWGEARFDAPVPHLYVPRTKNGDSKRLILTEDAVDALRRLPSYGSEEYVFPARGTARFPHPKRPYRWDFGKDFRTACRLAGVRDLRIHDLRHYAPSLLLAQGVPDGIVRKLTGHRSRELYRYQHLAPEVKKQTVDLIAEELLHS